MYRLLEEYINKLDRASFVHKDKNNNLVYDDDIIELVSLIKQLSIYYKVDDSINNNTASFYLHSILKDIEDEEKNSNPLYKKLEEGLIQHKLAYILELDEGSSVMIRALNLATENIDTSFKVNTNFKDALTHIYINDRLDINNIMSGLDNMSEGEKEAIFDELKDL